MAGQDKHFGGITDLDTALASGLDAETLTVGQAPDRLVDAAAFSDFYPSALAAPRSPNAFAASSLLATDPAGAHFSTPPGAATLGTITEMSAYLTDGYWQGQNLPARHWTAGSTISVNLSALSTSERGFAERAMAAWAQIANIDFTVVAGAADLVYTSNNGPGGARTASTASVLSGNTIVSSAVNISANWADPSAAYGYMYQTYLRETGHALGLGNLGPYDANAVYGVDNVFTNDSWQLSVMSGFDQDDNTSVTGSTAFVATPQTVDIAAIVSLYGARPGGTRDGNTTYGFNSTAGNDFTFTMFGFGAVNDNTITLYDTGGIDTLDASGTTHLQRIDLRGGAMSSLNGQVANVLIAPGTVIENVIGNGSDEIFIGNAADNIINGNSGLDTLVLSGTRGQYTLVDNDTVFVLTGNGGGTDTLLGIERFQFADMTIDTEYGGMAIVGNYGAIGDLQTVGDRDSFRSDIDANGVFTVRLLGDSSGNGTLADPFLRVLFPDGSLSDDNSGAGFDSLLIFHATALGPYTISAGSSGDAFTGTYRVTVSQTAFTAAGSWTGAGAGTQGWYVGDFNGDGLDDIFRYNAGISGAEVFQNVRSGFGFAGSWTGAGSGTQGWYLGDFNGDGKDDIFRYNPGISGAEVFLSDGASFVADGSWTGSGSGDQGWYIGDFDGDGRSDALRYHGGVAGAEVLLSSGDGFGAATNWSGYGNNGHWHVGDFNGDGRDDVMRTNPDGSGAQVLLSTGSGFGGPVTWTIDSSGSEGWYVGDFNADGRDDLLRYRAGISGGEVYLSNGSSFVLTGNWVGAGSGSDGWHIGHFNDDDAADIFRYNPGVSGAEVFLV